MKKELTNIISQLYTAFCIIFGSQFVKNHHTEQFIKMWIDEWSQGLEGIDENYIKQALHYCRLHLQWVPSMAEFIGLCDRAAGMPSCDESLRAAIRRDFSHPVTKMAFDKIGDWDMRHDSQEVLTKKFKSAYEESVMDMRVSRNNSIAQLEAPGSTENIIDLSGIGNIKR